MDKVVGVIVAIIGSVLTIVSFLIEIQTLTGWGIVTHGIAMAALVYVVLRGLQWFWNLPT